MRTVAFVAVAALAVAGCGAAATFQLTSDDNDPVRLEAALRRAEATRPGPLNATGAPLAFLVARGTPKELVAFDLAARRERWRVATDVTSKVAVGGPIVAHLEGERTLVARDVATGKPRWSKPIDGSRLVGAAADRERLYYTVEDKRGARPRWILHGVDAATGAEVWRAEAPGALGAPAARDGLVFSPFLKQWLAVLDGRTGEQLTRVRGLDEEIAFVRATPEAVYFGSSAGVFRLDPRAASGTREGSAYARATIPKAFARAAYGFDAFDPVQAGYSAYDRSRLLWRGEPGGKGLRFAGDRVVVAAYRFFFGFAAGSGALDWAYRFPRVDVVGSAHVGPAIVFASMLGELGALDPASGRRIYQAEVKGQLIGASFDAEGFAPHDEVAGDPGSTAEALTAIARDRDARFIEVKQYAIEALSKLGASGGAADLVALVTDERTGKELVDGAVASLVRRRDPRGLPALTAALAIRADHLAGTAPRAVGPLARAAAALAGVEVAAGEKAALVAALRGQLASPALPEADLAEVVRALGAFGEPADLDALVSLVLLHRADPASDAAPEAIGAALEVLAARGGPRGREVVGFVADDARTAPAIKALAERTRLQPTTAAAATATK